MKRKVYGRKRGEKRDEYLLCGLSEHKKEKNCR
jgi:hypothetical protein